MRGGELLLASPHHFDAFFFILRAQATLAASGVPYPSISDRTTLSELAPCPSPRSFLSCLSRCLPPLVQAASGSTVLFPRSRRPLSPSSHFAARWSAAANRATPIPIQFI